MSSTVDNGSSSLADVLDHHGDPARAQEMLERFRAEPRLTRNQTLHIRPQTLPPSIAIVGYTS